MNAYKLAVGSACIVLAVAVVANDVRRYRKNARKAAAEDLLEGLVLRGPTVLLTPLLGLIGAVLVWNGLVP